MVRIIKSSHFHPLIVFTPNSLEFNKNQFIFNELKIGSRLDLKIFNSYTRVKKVENSSELSVNGDTIIAFLKHTQKVIRIELIGNNIENISQLDPYTLRKINDLQNLIIVESEIECLLDYDLENEFKSVINFYDNKSLENEDEYFSLPLYANKYEILKHDIAVWIDHGYKLFYYGTNISSAKDTLENIIENITNIDKNSLNIFIAKIEYKESSLADKGFYSAKYKVVYITDQELFGTLYFKSSIKNKNIGKLFEGKIKINDYIVHDLHGVGIYKGIISQEVLGERKDYLKIEYLDNDTLYVPYDSLDKITKYIGENSEPKLTKLSSNEWDKIKSKAAKDIEEIADELLDLYARRELEKGISYDLDSIKEIFDQFLLDFGYEDTEDQKKVTLEVIDDMESDKPMDRLLVGDVGFGKTEIAVRASFIAVLNKKQVVVLAPTTILVSQLFSVFNNRLGKYGVNIGKVSRFEGEKKNRITLEALEKGNLDIIVGTHRLLSNDVKVKNLGLLVIDEEQRFGVKQKEKIKEFKTNVDVLSMSATPIPRTLQMSVSGIRDISVITTPPPGRVSIKTSVITKNEVYYPIEAEIKRGGQVFIVHNNISTIESLAQNIKERLPDINIAVGHAKMSGEKLERIMTDFGNRSYDVLVATTIIENGIDIPTVNTMIIDDAQNFGLSQLHQLRGRVGRSNVQAFCYLVVPYLLNKGKILDIEDKDNKSQNINIEGIERIKAILEFQSLGAGFNIASKDMELRGSGNLLGASQSGHINNLGYEMYLRMLYQQIEKKKSKI